MKLIDDLAEVIRQAPIIAIDPAFLTKMNPMKAYDGLELRPEYKSLISSMLMMYDDAQQRGVPRERAVAVVLGTHEEMVRYVITKAIKDQLEHMPIITAQTFEADAELRRIKEEIAVATTELAEAERLRTEEAKNKTTEQFKAYLKYAAGKWGAPVDMRAVDRLIKKIT